MREVDLDTFQSEQSEDSESDKGLPETPPGNLLTGFIPPIKNREPIAPDDSSCNLKTGDLLVQHVGADALEYYGFLILSAYGKTKIIGINLHNQNYSCHDVEKFLSWTGDFTGDGGDTRVYRDIAPKGDSSESVEKTPAHNNQESGSVHS